MPYLLRACFVVAFFSALSVQPLPGNAANPVDSPPASFALPPVGQPVAPLGSNNANGVAHDAGDATSPATPTVKQHKKTKKMTPDAAAAAIQPMQDAANAKAAQLPLQPMVQDAQGRKTLPLPPPLQPMNASQLGGAVNVEAAHALDEAAQQRYQKNVDKAFKGIVPLDPNEVRETMQRYERAQRASIAPAGGQPTGQVRVKTLALEPGSETPTINVAAGYVTTVTILDATGQPWPITDIGVGGSFEVTKTTGASHVVRIMPLTRFGFGNISVLLQDFSTPIIFKLASGNPTVDYRFDARIPRLGPNAKSSLIDRKGLQAGSAAIMTFLDNAPPGDAKRLRVSGMDSRTMVWEMNDRMYVRTPLTMISPSWDASVASADGTNVYELAAAPVLLLSDNGMLVRARITQKDQD